MVRWCFVTPISSLTPSSRLAVGLGTATIGVSNDPTAPGWGQVTIGGFSQGLSVAHGLDRWVICGSGGTNTMVLSPDGSSFIATGRAVFSTFCSGVHFGAGKFVAVGSGTNTLAYSITGTSFVGLGQPYFSGFPGGLGIAFGGGLWVAAGGGSENSLAVSADGISFTGVGTVISGIGYVIASNLNASVSNSAAGSPCASLQGCSCTGSACTSAIPVATSGTIAVSTNSTLAVAGTLTLAPSATLVVNLFVRPSGTLATSTSNATVGGTLQLVIGNIDSGSVTVLQAASIAGRFANVVTSSSSPCSDVASSAPVYGPTTITVAFQTSNKCGLSAGAIVGIVCGAVLVALLIVLLLILGMRLLRSRSDAGVNREIRMAAIDAAKKI